MKPFPHKKISIFLSLLFMLLFLSLSGQAQTRRGFMVSDLGMGDDSYPPALIAMDSQKRIMVFGERYMDSLNSDLFLVCLAANGERCSSFGDAGLLNLDFGNSGYDSAVALAVDDQDRILLAGITANLLTLNGPDDVELFISRLTSEGTVDISFGTEGILNGGLTELEESLTAIQSFDMDSSWTLIPSLLFDGASLSIDLTIYDSEGTPFTLSSGVTFVIPDGFVPHDVQLDSQTRMIVTGYYGYTFAAARYFLDGTPDTAFGNNGFFTTNSVCTTGTASLARIAPDDSIYLIGSCDKSDAYNNVNDSFAVVKLDASGQLDDSFGTGGFTVTDLGKELNTTSHDEAEAAAIDVDGNLIVAGTYIESGEYANLAVARYTVTGELDTSFGDVAEETTPEENENNSDNDAGADNTDNSSSSGGCRLNPTGGSLWSFTSLAMIISWIIGWWNYRRRC